MLDVTYAKTKHGTPLVKVKVKVKLTSRGQAGNASRCFRIERRAFVFFYADVKNATIG